jgi:polar amino acid transport system substrate-binding protein
MRRTPTRRGSARRFDSLARAARALAAPVALLLGLAGAAQAQESVAAPSFWDPARSLAKPDLGGLRQLRFVTEDDYPPFNFALADGQLVGFNVDLARAVCEELELSCTIQRRRWDLLIPALEDNSADAIAASLAMSPESRARVDFTNPYYVTPGRFVMRVDSVLRLATPEALEGQLIAVVAGSRHEAYLQSFFPKSQLASFDTAEAARLALKGGRVNALFGDAIALSFWLNGAEAAGCCAFRGGPYLDTRFFGEGVGFAVKKGATPLRRALDYALARLSRRGVYAELYFKYFPVGPF